MKPHRRSWPYGGSKDWLSWWTVVAVAIIISTSTAAARNDSSVVNNALGYRYVVLLLSLSLFYYIFTIFLT